MAQILHYCLSCLLLKETLKCVNTKLDISRMLSYITRMFENIRVRRYANVASKKLKTYIFAINNISVVAVMVIS